MEKAKLFYFSVLSSFATFVYVILVAWIMINGDKYLVR